MVLEEKSTAHKFLSFQYMTCTNSCPNEEGYGGQNEDQPDIGTAQNVNFNISDDWDKAMNKNMEELIIPQPSVPQKIMHNIREEAHKD